MIAQPSGERRTRTISSYQKASWADLADLVNRHQVWMIQACRDFTLTLETAAHFLGQKNFWARHFQGYLPLQDGIDTQKDHAMPASAQFPHEAEAPQGSPEAKK